MASLLRKEREEGKGWKEEERGQSYKSCGLSPRPSRVLHLPGGGGYMRALTLIPVRPWPLLSYFWNASKPVVKVRIASRDTSLSPSPRPYSCRRPTPSFAGAAPSFSCLVIPVCKDISHRAASAADRGTPVGHRGFVLLVVARPFPRQHPDPPHPAALRFSAPAPPCATSTPTATTTLT
jgi:hypothetical protein